MTSSSFDSLTTIEANTESYLDTGLSARTTYYYRIQSYNSTARSAYSDTATAKTLAPGSPTGFTAVYSTTPTRRVRLSWDAAPYGTTAMVIERQERTGAPGTRFNRLSVAYANTVEYTDNNVRPDRIYAYRMQVYNYRGRHYTNTVTVSTYETVPGAPDSLKAMPRSAREVLLEWVDRSTNETEFRVYRKKSSETNYAKIADVPKDTRSYVDSAGLEPGTSYDYRVVAYNPVGESGYSNTYTVTTPDLIGIPSPPSSLSASAASSSRIDLSWTDNSDNETGFRIERRLSTGTDADFSQIDTTAVNATAYTDSGLVPSTLYLYRILAYNTAGSSEYSDIARATTQPPPPSVPSAPSSLTATAASSTEINLSWTDNSTGETGFKIERKLTSAADDTYSQVATPGADATTYTDSGLDEGTGYTYRVRSHNAGGDSDYSDPAAATTWPHAPTNLSGSVSMRTVSLGWTDNSSVETGFEVERKEGDSSSMSSYASIGSAAANATTYSDSGLQWNTTYTYRVRALISGIHSSYSNTYTVTTPDSTGTPPPPSSLSASAASSTEIRLSWTDNSDKETGFKIERRLSTGTDADFSQIDSTAVNATTYTDSGLSASTTYVYRVRAYNTAGNSAYSNTARATTLPSPPSAPSSLIATAASSSSIRLSWTDNSDDETGFYIERKLSTEANYALIDSTGADATTYTDSGLVPGNAYYYRVRAYNAGGSSAYSNTARPTIQPPSPAPSSLTARAGSSTEIRLTWTDNSDDETRFEVDRKLASAHDSTYSQIATASANETTYTDSGLDEGTGYTYRVRAHNAGGNSDYSDPAAAVTWPHAPTNLSGSVSMRTVSLDWTDNSSVETGYEVERKEGTAGSTSSYASIGSAAADATTYSDSGLQWNTTYTYRVRASMSGVHSSYSNTYTVTTPDSTDTPPPPPPSPPAAPTALLASAATSSKINLSWTDNADNETGFKIERKLSTEDDNAFSQIDTTSANTTSYADTGLTHSTTYVYRLRAYNGGGDSGYSGTAQATTKPPPPSPPAAPTALSASAASSSKINLSWTGNSNDVTGFRIERRLSTETGTGFSQIATAGANDTTYTDSGRQEGTGYTYRVRAYNPGGNSDYSNTATAVTWPHAPTNLSGSVSMRTVSLSWTDNSSVETGYEVERKEGDSSSASSYASIASTAANATTYSDSGLQWSTAYTYRVRASASGVRSSYSNTFSVTTPNPPGPPPVTSPTAPSSLTATAASSSSIDLAWKDASDNETGFRIERKLTSEADSTFSQVGTASANATSYTDGSLSASTDYTYRIRAYNSAGNSAYSGTARATTQAPPPPPSAPSDLSADPRSPTSVRLSWTDNSDDETGFKIERKLAPEPDNAFSQIGKTGANTMSYTDSGLSPSTTYIYRVRAYNANGNSGYSDAEKATTPSNLPRPPSGLSASAQSSSAIKLSWTDNSDNETGFRIERRLTSAADNTFSQVGTASADDTTYTDSGLDEGTGYTYRVRAYNANGNSVYSATASATTHETLPSSPSSLSARAASSSSIRLNWTDNADNETGFKVERKLASAADSTFSQVGTAGANARSYTDGGLVSDTGYTYRVRAYNSAGNSGYSGTASATTNPEPPAAPSSLTATARSSSRIDLTWKDASHNETGFKIERKLSSQGDASFSQVGTASANAESYTDGSLSASTGYTYRVRSYNSAGNSGYSDTASATTHAPPPPPSAPSGLSADPRSPTSVRLSWTDNSDDETGFKIERKLAPEPDSAFSQIGKTGANTTSYTDSGLSPSTTYIYRVRAYNANGNSGYSGVDKATTPVPLPSAPSSLSASARSSTSVRLSWTDNADNERGFKIERKLSSQNDASFSQIGTAAANARSYTDTGLSANTGYTYRVRAYNSGGNSGYSGTASATTNMALPSAPSSLSASARSSSSIRLSWTDNADNEAGFKIERKLSSQNDASFSQVGTASANARSYTDSGLSASTGYTYRVRAYNSSGNSGYSGTASATTRATRPNAPFSLNATARSSSSIRLTWRDASHNESGFKIERKKSSQGDASFSQVGTAGANATSYTDGSLSASTGYTYRVRAYNSAGNSSYSGTASATTHAPPPPPSAPSGLSADPRSPTSVRLSWTDNSTNETGFKIERKLSSQGDASFSQIGTTGANDTDYTDSGLSPSTTYVYRVRAYNANGNSGYSGTDKATTPSNLPRAPSGLSASAASSSRINLSWTDNANNESGFKIERKKSTAGSYSQIGTASANATSYADTGLDEGTGYTYRVRAYNAAGNSTYSGTASATTHVTRPSAPSGLSASARSSSSIRLSWTDNADNEAGFRIERKLSSQNDTSFRQIGTAAANARSYTDSGLIASTGYTYRVRAYNAAGNSSYSGTASATTRATPPAAPSSLTATAKSSSSITLAWKDASHNEAGFKIERKLSSQNDASFSQVGTASANAESYTDTGLSASTRYTYRIRAYNSVGNSSYTGTASATTKAPSPPAAPSGLYAEVRSSSSVDLSWDDNSNDETGFKIERKLATQGDASFSQIGTTGADDTDYTDSGLSPSTTYIYRVRAYNAGGNSGYSGADRATTSAAARAVVEIFEFALEGSRPNPFREHATIVYTLPEVAAVRLEVFNILGQQVRTLIDEARPPGRHEIAWDGRDNSGRMVSSGVYILRMTAGDFVEYRKMTFLK